MREPVTITVVTRELARLNGLFAKWSAAELEGVARGYREALDDLDAEQLAGAVGMAMREETRFPPPAVLRAHAKVWRAANRPGLLPAYAPTPDAAVAGEAPVCRVCGSRPRLAWIEGRHHRTGEVFHVKRYIAPCDPTRHTGGYVPAPPEFRGWVEEGAS